MKFSTVTLVVFGVSVANASIHGERPRDRDYEGKLRGGSPHEVRASNDFEDYDARSNSEHYDARLYSGDYDARSYSEGYDARSHFEGGTARAKPRDWTYTTSEEKPPISCGNSLVEAMHCSGRYCDDISMRCANEENKEFTNLTPKGNPTSTDWFSEENGGVGKCPKGFVTGLRCKGSFCDKIFLDCQEWNEAIRTDACEWSIDYLSEENNVDTKNHVYSGSNQGYYVAGIQCFGSNCDKKKLYSCKAEKPRSPDQLTKNSPIGYWRHASSYNGNKQLKYFMSWSMTETTENEFTETAKYEITSAIEAGVEFSLYGADAEVKTSVSATAAKEYSLKAKKTLQKEVKESVEETFECEGSLYVWELLAKADNEGGIGWEVSTEHLRCIPLDQDPPKCPPDQFLKNGIESEWCKCPYAREHFENVVECDGNDYVLTPYTLPQKKEV